MKLDERAKELARIVVEYSTAVKKGDLVAISGELVALPFMQEIARRVVDKGSYPTMSCRTPENERYFYEHAADDQLARLPNFEIAKAEEIDAYIGIKATANPLNLQGVEPKRISAANAARAPVSDIIIGDGEKYQGKRWVLVGYPVTGDARQAGMTLTKYADVVFGATNIQWEQEAEKMKKVKDAFDNAEDVHIYVPGLTDLHLSLKGRGGEICDGKHNMPDGEVFYGPLEESANGVITFTYPAVREGNLVEGIRIAYKAGEVVECSARKNQKFLEAMLDLEGAKRIGELGIGCNPGITRYMKNLLFDEKIGGTIHLAMGRSISQPLDKGGGLNKSPLHWDIVCELRKLGNQPGGQLKVDGKLVQEKGIWLI
ncbi:MAG: aminopeptidase [Nanoarchaeota archaeon]|nr:aminopeptidase [Nanoarchaeota archaeon]